MKQSNLAHSQASEEVLIIKPSNSTVLNSIDSRGKGASINRACLGGYCGSCRTVLVEGEVEYIDEPLACISENEILPCYCKAVTPITIEL